MYGISILNLYCFLKGRPDPCAIYPLVVLHSDKLDLEPFYQDLPKYKPFLSASA